MFLFHSFGRAQGLPTNNHRDKHKTKDNRRPIVGRRGAILHVNHEDTKKQQRPETTSANRRICSAKHLCRELRHQFSRYTFTPTQGRPLSKQPALQAAAAAAVVSSSATLVAGTTNTTLAVSALFPHWPRISPQKRAIMRGTPDIRSVTQFTGLCRHDSGSTSARKNRGRLSRGDSTEKWRPQIGRRS